jgi:competence ComEA-like helix-hairpin-helix protein
MAKKSIFKQLKIKLFDAFDFSRSEQRGIIVLLIILLFLVGFRIALSYVQTSGEVSEHNPHVVQQFLSMQQHYHDSVLLARQQRSFYTGSPQEWRNYSSSRKLIPFAFNPDTMSFSNWKKMGFTEKEAQQIVNYQSKGGRFFQKSDFKKLYCVSDEDYQLLESYIQLASKEKSEQKWESTKALPHAKLNLNNVDSIQLQKIPGIGQKTASRIVRYREKLGGFVHIHQLKEVYAIDSNRFLQIEPYLFVDKTNIKKLNINKLDIKALIKHPYIDYYLAKSIVDYRQKHGKYTVVEDVKKSVHFYDELYQKIVPYLEVE